MSLIAALLFAAPAPGAASGAAAADALETRVTLVQTGDADNPTPRGGFSVGGWHRLIAPAELPAAVRQPGERAARMMVQIESDGRVSACDPFEADAAADSLARAACAVLLGGKTMAPRYVAPGEAVVSRRIFTIRLNTRSAAEWKAVDNAPISPAPPPPPGILFSLDQKLEWPPRFSEYGHMALGPLPDVVALAPAAVKGPRATTAISLGIAADGTRRCAVTESSGDPLRDAAACVAATTLTVRYAKPCDLCFAARVPMLLHWDGRKSRFQLPVQASQRAPRVVQSGLRAGQFGTVPPAGGRSHATLYVAIDAAGRATGCRTAWSSGDAALDARMCAALRDKGRFAAGSDLFGRPLAGEATIYVKFADIFPAS